MAVIEIQTIEGGRFAWAAIYLDSDQRRAIEWGDRLLQRVHPRPSLRILDHELGNVIGAWQDEGYEGVSS